MKKLLMFFMLALTCMLCCVGAFGCDNWYGDEEIVVPEEIKDTSLAEIEKANGFRVKNGIYTLTVTEDTEIADLRNLIKVSDGATWALMDENKTEEVNVGRLEIFFGDNKFIAVVTSQDETVTKDYTIVVSRPFTSYTVTFDSNGGSAVDSLIVGKGNHVLKPEDPTMRGYTLTEWLYDGEPWSFNGSTVTEDMTLVASWTPTVYSINYNLIGNYDLDGEFSFNLYNNMRNPSSYTIESGEISFDIPSRLGYSFKGWSVAKIPEGSVGEITTTAIWEIVNFKINYNLNGGINNESNPDTYTIKDETIVFAEPTMDDCVFKGWSLSQIPHGSVGEKTISANFESLIFTVSNNAITGLTDYGKTLTSLVVPEFLNGQSITKIDVSAFNNNSLLEHIVLPESVTDISGYAFNECISLLSVNIPSGIKNIGYDAFYHCSSITSITIPSGATIGTYAFGHCDALTEIIIEKGVKSIGGYAFASCSNLKNITIPDSVTTIGDNAFQNCGSLTSITIPDSVTTIGDYAFQNCGSLTSVNIPNGITSIGACLFYNCSSLTSITIPDSVTSIGRGAFYNCSSLTSITIPNKLTDIQFFPFIGCSGLTSITVVSGNTKYHSNGNCLIDTTNKELILGCNNSVIPTDGSVTKIGQYAFYNCSGLTSISIPEGVTRIGYGSFLGCSSLINITIPNSISSIDENAFDGCSSITKIYYKGNQLKWFNLTINNDSLLSADIYYYSETVPTTNGNYWHYVDELITEW